MDLHYFESLPSTQTYLIEEIQERRLNPPVCVMAKEQTEGIGSRDNKWEGGSGNLFFSFAVLLKDLPEDLPLSSASIYFSCIMKQILVKHDQSVWVKWPNDLYQKSHKIGGTITKKIDNILLCGMGINLKKNSNGFKALNLNVEPNFLLEAYLEQLEKYPDWKQIFSHYRVEFEKSRAFYTHVNGELKSLEKAILSEDGSLIIDKKRVYSIR
ncbi:MAG TPA: biotin--[acetyl-CoA-carboxylase] ligase [Campylobacterales bacterium]|nr:biotin--[acetyl-CoA-carboxylase] ligase [Campylobacterales bacterium]HHS92329.1 biotin--[acetyl-CoA-carboxylase] ligase [Campylobacterales bacterium]